MQDGLGATQPEKEDEGETSCEPVDKELIAKQREQREKQAHENRVRERVAAAAAHFLRKF